LPSRKKASRGVVAIQFGLPRPALSIAALLALADSFAALMNMSLSSKGLNVFRSLVAVVAMWSSFPRSLR
jgi:hypothetical protein